MLIILILRNRVWRNRSHSLPRVWHTQFLSLSLSHSLTHIALYYVVSYYNYYNIAEQKPAAPAPAAKGGRATKGAPKGAQSKVLMSPEGNPLSMYPEGFGVPPAVRESGFEEPPDRDLQSFGKFVKQLDEQHANAEASVRDTSSMLQNLQRQIATAQTKNSILHTYTKSLLKTVKPVVHWRRINSHSLAAQAEAEISSAVTNPVINGVHYVLRMFPAGTKLPLGAIPATAVTEPALGH
jgi:hypothetical protein